MLLSERPAHIAEMVRQADCIREEDLSQRFQVTTQTIALIEQHHLRVVSNNLNIVRPACSNPTFEVAVAGGRLDNESRDVMGIGMEALFEADKVDIGIYGVAGVDNDGTLLDFYEE
jgi:DeoR family glycerol-3-phosphate regulon repressor